MSRCSLTNFGTAANRLNSTVSPTRSQKAAAAVYSEEGWKQVRESIDYYMEKCPHHPRGASRRPVSPFSAASTPPYIWLKTPQGLSSWDFFDKLLNECHVVGTPGSGFGHSGEGYFRLSAFGDRENIEEAVKRIINNLS